MGVPSPPILQAHARPRSNGGANAVGALEVAITASATGNSIRTVAVLDIHILSSAAANIKPNISRFGSLAPTNLTTVIAIRVCAPVDSIPFDSKNPPMSSKINGDPYAAATSAGAITPRSGNTPIGTKDVTGMGMGSKTHQKTQSMATAVVIDAACDWPKASDSKPALKATNSPGIIDVFKLNQCDFGIAHYPYLFVTLAT